MKHTTKLSVTRTFRGFVILPFFSLISHSIPAFADRPIGQANACEPISVDSGTNDGGTSINDFLNDQYTWSDSACLPRSVALARNDTSKGGNAKQFTYTLEDSSTRTIDPLGSAGGFGYIVAHLVNPSFANAYGKDDSPLGSGNSATYRKIFTGRHHAIYQYTLNYVRYGLTSDAIENGSLDPYTWIEDENDPNRSFVRAYNMPVRIQWMFATGRNYPIWTVTFDLSAAPSDAIISDFRAPYGEMQIEGGDGGDTVGGVAWGDIYKFVTSGNVFTMDNDWDYSESNSGAPYDYLWTTNADAEMGLAGTQVTALQNAGGYNNYQAPAWRGQTSASMGQICTNDEGSGPGYDHKLPCTSDWAYQLIQYSVSSANETTSSKRLGWGSDWGSLGTGSFDSTNGFVVSGYPKVSYSVYVVVDPHSINPTENTARQAEVINSTSVTATVGKVLKRGPAGVGRSDTKGYTPDGFSPIFSTWEVRAAKNKLNITFSVPDSGTTLDMPILVVRNYKRRKAPTSIMLDGNALTADSDYFLSQRRHKSELWITLNQNLVGEHTFEIGR